MALGPAPGALLRAAAQRQEPAGGEAGGSSGIGPPAASARDAVEGEREPGGTGRPSAVSRASVGARRP